MKIVQGDEMPLDAEASNVRGGVLKKWPFLVGEPGTPGNFKFGLFHQTGDFFSPRHRHNFDQFRFQIDGECDFDRNGKMKPGVLGYFPEGAYYGPQSCKGANLAAVVQFGGPSGSGYLAQRQVDAAYAEMKKFGSFDQGVFRRKEGVAGRKNMDSFQAVWEFANQRPMVYPKPQYADPILMNPDAFRWQPLAGVRGVEEKALGTFTDCNIRCGRYKLSPGSSFTGKGRGLFLVLSGKGSVDGGPLRRYTAAYLKDGEQTTFRAEETAEILLLGLPDESRIGMLPLIADETQESTAA
jgi:hypothetical protein